MWLNCDMRKLNIYMIIAIIFFYIIFNKHIRKSLLCDRQSLRVRFKVFNREEKLDWSETPCISARRKKWPGSFLDFYIVPLRYLSPSSSGCSLCSVIRVNASLKNSVIIAPSSGKRAARIRRTLFAREPPPFFVPATRRTWFFHCSLFLLSSIFLPGTLR